jgi:hypothetical protein
MKRILFLMLFVLQSFCTFSQTWWKVENEYGDVILLTIEINTGKNTFTAYTRKEALKDIAGSITFTLAKTAGKLKYPEIVFIEGTTRKKADSLLLTGTFTYFDKQFPFSGAIAGNSFSGVYSDKNRQRKLTGEKMPNDNPLADYKIIINTALSNGEKYLADPAWVKSGDWQDFKKDMGELKPKIKDDYEMAAAITWLGKKLPFSPFEINKINPHSKTSLAPKTAFREINTKTILFDVNNFPSTKHAFDSLIAIIVKKGYGNMILDLRGRTGINPAAANYFANFISKKTFTAGVFLTRKWFAGNPSVPEAKDFEKLFKSFGETGYKANSLYTEKGRIFKVVPAQNLFKGKVFVLTDSRTSKVSELLVHILKTEKMVMVVGQKTSGSAFMVERISVNTDFELILPVAEFYSSDGKPFEKNGIEPDKTVTNEDILQFVLKNLL